MDGGRPGSQGSKAPRDQRWMDLGHPGDFSDLGGPYPALAGTGSLGAWVYTMRHNGVFLALVLLLVVTAALSVTTIALSTGTFFNAGGTQTAARTSSGPPDRARGNKRPPLPPRPPPLPGAPNRAEWAGEPPAHGRPHTTQLHHVFYYATGTHLTDGSPYASLGAQIRNAADGTDAVGPPSTPRMFDLPFTRQQLEAREIVSYSACCHTDRLAICNHMDLAGYEMELLLSYEDRRVSTPGWKLIMVLGARFEDPECHFVLEKDEVDHSADYVQAAGK